MPTCHIGIRLGTTKTIAEFVISNGTPQESHIFSSILLYMDKEDDPSKEPWWKSGSSVNSSTEFNFYNDIFKAISSEIKKSPLFKEVNCYKISIMAPREFNISNEMEKFKSIANGVGLLGEIVISLEVIEEPFIIAQRLFDPAVKKKFEESKWVLVFDISAGIIESAIYKITENKGNEYDTLPSYKLGQTGKGWVDQFIDDQMNLLNKIDQGAASKLSTTISKGISVRIKQNYEQYCEKRITAISYKIDLFAPKIKNPELKEQIKDAIVLGGTGITPLWVKENIINELKKYHLKISDESDFEGGEPNPSTMDKDETKISHVEQDKLPTEDSKQPILDINQIQTKLDNLKNELCGITESKINEFLNNLPITIRTDISASLKPFEKIPELLTAIVETKNNSQAILEVVKKITVATAQEITKVITHETSNITDNLKELTVAVKTIENGMAKQNEAVTKSVTDGMKQILEYFDKVQAGLKEFKDFKDALPKGGTTSKDEIITDLQNIAAFSLYYCAELAKIVDEQKK